MLRLVSLPALGAMVALSSCAAPADPDAGESGDAAGLDAGAHDVDGGLGAPDAGERADAGDDDAASGEDAGVAGDGGSPGVTPGPGTVGPGADLPGIHDPATLTVHEGNYVTEADGERIEGLDIRGHLVVQHANVVGVNVRARVVTVTDAASSVALEWCEIGERDGNHRTYNAVGLGNFDLRGCEVYGSVDLLKHRFGFVRVRDSWLHEAYRWGCDTAQRGCSSPQTCCRTDPSRATSCDPANTSCGAPELCCSSHPDYYQSTLAEDLGELVLEGNVFDAWNFGDGQSVGDVFGDYDRSRPATGIISVFQHNSAFRIGPVTIRGNTLRGKAGAFLYFLHDPGEKPTDPIRVTDNVFEHTGPNFGAQRLLSITPDDDLASDIEWARNVDETGAEITLATARN